MDEQNASEQDYAAEIINRRKQALIDMAANLTDASVKAQDWIRANEKRVIECGKSVENLLADMRRQARLGRKLERAAKRKMCAGVFGPSQAGKSYLLSSMAQDADKNVLVDFNGEQHDFLRELNPSGDKESTGLVTRFTMTPPADIPEGYPVFVRLFSETELVKIFANSYFCDGDYKEKVSKEKIQAAIQALKERAASTEGSPVSLDDMEDLREYITGSFGGRTRAAALDEVYWNDAIAMAPHMTLEDRAKLYGIIWDDIPEFNAMFLDLARDLEALGNPDEAFCRLDALLPRGASIIDVETLGSEDFSQFGVGATISMRSRNGKVAEIKRKNATAIIAELTLVMTNKPAAYFDHTDLLDFPGYKGRMECSDIADYLQRGKEDSHVEQFFRRGKVAYLFQRYYAERELTSLLLCVATPDNTPGLPAAVEEWIASTHGRTPEDRLSAKTSLFYILTKSDRHFEDKGGAKLETRWDDVIKGMFLGHFSGPYSQATRWVEEWTPHQVFNNLFMLRNIHIKWDSMMEVEEKGDIWTEKGVRPEKKEYSDSLRKAFLESPLAQRYFRDPRKAFDEVMKTNDGGIGYIKQSLEPLCDPQLKFGQIAHALDVMVKTLVNKLTPLYSSGDAEEELKKKKIFFGNFGRLFKIPAFQERFPELLNNFKIAPEQLYYLRDEADRKYDKYKESKLASIQEEAKEAAKASDVEPEGDPLDFLDDVFSTSPQATQAAPLTEGKDELYFYAERIVAAWNEKMRALAETPELDSYYSFNKEVYQQMLDEMDQAVARMDLQGRMVKKFREIAEPLDVPRENKVRKQAAYAIGLLNDFVSWLGMKPSEISPDKRKVNYQGKDVEVFASKPEVTDYPVLSESFVPFSRQWYRDWLTAFYGMLEDNVKSVNGDTINLAENMRLGELIKRITEEKARA